MSVSKASSGEGSGGWFKRLKQGLKKSSQALGTQVVSLLKHRKVDATTLEALEELLLQADLGVSVSTRLVERVRQQRFPTPFDPEKVQTFLANEMKQLLQPCEKPLIPEKKLGKPWVCLMVGVNGSGKTTTLGKLAALWKAQGYTLRLVAGDTFRAAAVEQLAVWASRSNVPLQQGKQGADSAGLLFEAYQAACQNQEDILLVDTAGRLQNKAHLMEELSKIVRVLKKHDPEAPHSCVLVLDGTVGQNAFSQVELFKKTVALTGLIMTKLDGTAKGGVLVGLAEAFRLPFHAIGLGEGIEDLQPFRADSFASLLMGVEPPETLDEV